MKLYVGTFNLIFEVKALSSNELTHYFKTAVPNIASHAKTH